MTSARPRQLFRHGGIYVATSIATAALAFAVLPIYVAILGKEGLGSIEILAAGSTALAFVVAQGLPSSWFRMRFDHQGEVRHAFESALCWYLLGSSALTIALLTLIGPALAERFTPSIPFYPLWLLATVSACAGLFGDTYAVGLQADQRSLSFAGFTLARRIGIVVVILVFIAGFEWGVPGKVGGEACAAVAVMLFVLIRVRPRLPSRSSRPLIASALAYGLPLLPHGLAMQAVSTADRFVLGHYLGLGAVGVYSLGYRIASVLETVNFGLSSAYRAMFMSSVADLERAHEVDAATRDNALAKLANTELVLLAASSMFGQALSVGTRELLLLTSVDLREFAGAWTVTYIVCWGLFTHAVYAVLAAPITYARHATARLPFISGSAALVNLLACLVFVPRAGMIAAAWATAAAHATLALGAWVVGRNIVPLGRPLGRWAGLFILTTGVLVAGWFIDRHVAAEMPRIAGKALLLAVSWFVTLRVIGMSPRALFAALANANTSVERRP